MFESIVGRSEATARAAVEEIREKRGTAEYCLADVAGQYHHGRFKGFRGELLADDGGVDPLGAAR